MAIVRCVGWDVRRLNRLGSANGSALLDGHSVERQFWARLISAFPAREHVQCRSGYGGGIDCCNSIARLIDVRGGQDKLVVCSNDCR